MLHIHIYIYIYIYIYIHHLPQTNIFVGMGLSSVGLLSLAALEKSTFLLDFKALVNFNAVGFVIPHVEFRKRNTGPLHPMTASAYAG